MSFDHQTIIVTGGTRGIGAAITTTFLKSNALVFATYCKNDQAAEQFRQNHRAFADHLHVISCDVSKVCEIEKLYKTISEKTECIHVLVNNAGIRRDKIVGMMTEQEWDQVLDTNLKGCYLMCKGCIPFMSRFRKGRIINISSPSGRLGFPGQANYAASKAGMVALSKSLSQELANRGITVNCVSPGFVSTELLADLPAELKEKYTNMVPMKRFGTPEEIAAAVVFLASKEASYITGAVLEVSGGLS